MSSFKITALPGDGIGMSPSLTGSSVSDPLDASGGRAVHSTGGAPATHPIEGTPLRHRAFANKAGPEVTNEAIRVLETIVKHTELKLEITSKDFGGAAIDAAGDPLPEDTLKSCKEADAILLGTYQCASARGLLEPWRAVQTANAAGPAGSVHV